VRQAQLRAAQVRVLLQALEEARGVQAHAAQHLADHLVAHARDAGLLLDHRAQLGLGHAQLRLRLLARLGLLHLPRG